jgi:hypothetical protein
VLRSVFHTVLCLSVSGGLAAAGLVGLASSANADGSASVFSGVLDISGGQPFSNVGIELRSTTGDDSGSATSGGDGSFAISVPPGSYNLLLEYYGDNFIPQVDLYGNSPIDLEHGDVTQNLTIPIATVTVHVIDSAGNPVVGAEVNPPFFATGTARDFYAGHSAVEQEYPYVSSGTDSNGDVSFATLVGITSGAGEVYPSLSSTTATAFTLPDITSLTTDLTVQLPPGPLASQVTLSSSAASGYIAGSPGTVTATVPTDAGSPAPTGVVTFKIDGTSQAPVPLSGGSAAFSLASLSPGKHKISAVYSGDVNYAAAQAPVLEQLVLASAAVSPASAAEVN